MEIGESIILEKRLAEFYKDLDKTLKELEERKELTFKDRDDPKPDKTLSNIDAFTFLESKFEELLYEAKDFLNEVTNEAEKSQILDKIEAIKTAKNISKAKRLILTAFYGYVKTE